MANKRNNNPRNPENELFKKLTRLLSGPITGYRRQAPVKPRRRDLGKYNFKSASGQSFKRNQYSPYDSMQANYMANQNRSDRYLDFDQMEYTPEIASSLDIYADEMTTSTPMSPMLKIDCSNQEIKTTLDVLYHNILNVNFNLFNWSRTMCKYGDYFLYLDIDETKGVKFAIGLPPNEVERIEGEDKTNPNYVQYQWNSGGITFENWQVAHFRVLGNEKHLPYGTSILEPARRIWRQLTLLEDAMMAYRIVRSPERRVFYIDVGNIPPEDIEQYMQKVVTQMKRNQIVDQNTGRVDLRYNPLSVEEDYFVPVRGNVSSRIENLPGGTYTGDIDDVKYLRDKLFSALKIPASYLSRSEEGGGEDKTTLAQKDIRFARTIQRLQRSVISELEKVGVIHLFTLGYRGDDLVSFKLALNNPSKIAELQDLEHWRTRFEVAGSATEGYFSKGWVAKHLFNLSEEDFVRIQREIYHDKRFEASLEQSVEEEFGAEGVEFGEEAGLGGLGGGGADAGLEAPEAGLEEPAAGEEIPEEPAPEAGGAEEGGLLVTPPDETPPAKRDEDWYKLKKRKNVFGGEKTTTSRSKGKWYEPRIEKRNMGARRRHHKSQYSSELASNTTRNVFKGYLDLKGLSNGISENLETTYNEEERKLFESNYELQKLIGEMESKLK